MNYEAPSTIADFSYVGSGFRERERIKRKVDRWMSKLEAMPQIERAALLSAMADRFGEKEQAAREGRSHTETGGDGRHRDPVDRPRWGPSDTKAQR